MYVYPIAASIRVAGIRIYPISANFAHIKLKLLGINTMQHSVMSTVEYHAGWHLRQMMTVSLW